MRKLLNKVLSPLGYEIQRLDRFAIELTRLLQAPSGVRFVQVGANDGVRFDNLYSIVTAHRCAGLVIEPLPDAFARLKANYANFPQIIPANVAVHATARSLPLYRVDRVESEALPRWADGIASFDKHHLLAHGIAERHIQAEIVNCAPLMELVAGHQFLDANVLQVDVEGYDAEVMRMIDFTRFKPQLMKYEHKNLSRADCDAIIVLLRKQGYKIARGSEDTVAWLV
jgi:FkbM family methyltransferase